MEQLKKYTLEVALTTLGIALLVIGLFFGADVVFFNLDGFYFFIGGLLLTIYGVGTIFTKIKEDKKDNSKRGWPKSLLIKIKRNKIILDFVPFFDEKNSTILYN